MDAIQQKAMEESKEGADNLMDNYSEDCEDELLGKVIEAFGVELEALKESNRQELAVQYAKFTSAY